MAAVGLGLRSERRPELGEMPRKKSKKQADEQVVSFTVDSQLVREAAGVLLVALGAVTALALLSFTKGALSEAWILFLRRSFGWGVYAVTFVLVAGGVVTLLADERRQVQLPYARIVGAEVLFLALLGASHLTVAPEQGFQLAARGGGGGFVGWALSYIVGRALGRGAALLLFLVGIVAGASLVARWTADDMRSAAEVARIRLAEMAAASSPDRVPSPPSRKRSSSRRTRGGTARETGEAPVESASRSRSVKRLSRGLPPLDLLDGGGNEPSGDADVRFQKQVIEETLKSFGVPAEVVEINQGPTITQFGLEPGFMEYRNPDGSSRRRKVKVSKIIALQDDLALALAVSPIRIEAPVPGRSLVGIEVPNDTVSLVGLRSVLESKAFRGIDSRLRVALGQDVSGEPVAADLALMPHLLIAGATGSGKSVCINSIVACLLLNNSPETLRLLMVDPKMVELTLFNGVPHLVAPVITSAEEAVRALRWVTQQMDERYRLFSRSGTRSIDGYNELAASQRQDLLPYIAIVVDELADLMMVAPDEIERHICRIAQLARATGIHLIIATQRPSVDVVTGLIKANFPARISFAVTSQVDSRVILDAPGAEKLLGRGDMLYMSSDSSKLVRMQGCFVSDEELQRIVRYWREQTAWVTSGLDAGAPWKNLPHEEETDELLDEAIGLTRDLETVSTSYLQRQLRIGYPRAARLIDLMETRGVVGPAVDGGRSREVLSPDDDWSEEEGPIA